MSRISKKVREDLYGELEEKYKKAIEKNGVSLSFSDYESALYYKIRENILKRFLDSLDKDLSDMTEKEKE